MLRSTTKDICTAFPKAIRRSTLIKKTTALGLFQEGERVSSDRLFRVRTSSTSVTKSQVTNSQLPTTSNLMHIGDVCVFMAGEHKLRFAQVNHKNKKTQEYKKSTAEISPDFGVLCSWFEVQKVQPDCLSCLTILKSRIHTYQPQAMFALSTMPVLMKLESAQFKVMCFNSILSTAN